MSICPFRTWKWSRKKIWPNSIFVPIFVTKNFEIEKQEQVQRALKELPKLSLKMI